MKRSYSGVNLMHQLLVVAFIMQTFVAPVTSLDVGHDCTMRCARHQLLYNSISQRSCVTLCCMSRHSSFISLLNNLPPSRLKHALIQNTHFKCSGSHALKFIPPLMSQKRATPLHQALSRHVSKRRWGNSMGACISSQCSGYNSESSRVMCIVARCGMRWFDNSRVHEYTLKPLYLDHILRLLWQDFIFGSY